jgi:hypothetical protein
MFSELLPYALLFSRTAVGLVFALSLVGKLRDLPAFARAVADFQILPGRLVPAAAGFIVAAELAVVGLMLLGGPFLAAGFGVALGLLLLFSAVIALALHHGLQTPCHCFGASTRIVSRSDLWRNAGFVAFSLLGFTAALTVSGEPGRLHMSEFAVISLMAMVLVIVWARMGELVELLRAG